MFYYETNPWIILLIYFVSYCEDKGILSFADTTDTCLYKLEVRSVFYD